MGERKINIFYLISFICTLILIGYIGLVFFPVISSYPEMQPIVPITLLIIGLLGVAAGIELFLLLRPPAHSEE
ncbi:MAG: hypothetical protein QW502_01925 [Candidatus Bathyarchaeia archaeon]|nr:hypothetical protein [Candidatus Bathyarchaeota archaeon]